VLLAAWALLAGGCLLLGWRLTYHRANVTAYGSRPPGLAGDSFDRIEIGAPERPFQGEPVLTLELPDGTTLRTDQLDVAALRARAERVTRDPRLWVEQHGWPAGIEEIALGGYRFLARDDRVVAIVLLSWWNGEEVRPAPAIAEADGRTLHRLPLDRRTLVALFGEPEHLSVDLTDLL